MADEMNEMGLLQVNQYDYEDDVSGTIDDSTNDSNDQLTGSGAKSKPKPRAKNKARKSEPAMIMQSNPHAQPNNNHYAPSPSPSDTKVSQCQSYLTSMFYWLPIRSLCLLGCVCMFVFPFIDDKFSSPTFIQYLLGWYIQFFALLGMFIESPTWWLTKRVQLAIFSYARFLRRTSGRAFFYFTVSLLTFAPVKEDGANLTFFAGVYMLGVASLMMVFSRLAAKQLHIMFAFMRNSEDVQGQHAEDQLTAFYNSIDYNRTGKVGSAELHTFAEQSLKRKLSNSENYTIRLYLDQSCLGYVTREDWTKQFMKTNKVKFL